MILRRHAADDTRSEALYSDCEVYRYRLSRTWGEGARLACVMLNPSTATELRNDPTIARCELRARRAGFGGVDILNLFACRATRPADLRAAVDPVGPENAAEVGRAVGAAGLILCGWGVHGGFRDAGAAMLDLLRARAQPLCHLGLTRDGHPRHPLYVGHAVPFQRWG